MTLTERDIYIHNSGDCVPHRCGCVLAHKPAQALADLLRAAVEVDEIADGIRPLLGPTIEAAIFGERADALRAAVRRLS